MPRPAKNSRGRSQAVRLGGCDGVQPPLPGHALQFGQAAVFEADSGPGDQLFDRLRCQHVTGCGTRGHPDADRAARLAGRKSLSSACSNFYGCTARAWAVTRRATMAPVAIPAVNLAQTLSRTRTQPSDP